MESQKKQTAEKVLVKAGWLGLKNKLQERLKNKSDPDGTGESPRLIEDEL